jgi:NAD-dependent deacetylase
MDFIESVLENADIFAAIGTSGHVYPAAGFVSSARFAGAETIEINNTQTLVSGSFDRHLIGSATVEVTRWVDELLS